MIHVFSLLDQRVTFFAISSLDSAVPVITRELAENPMGAGRLSVAGAGERQTMRQ
jgi:hypothetical protein